MSDLATERTVAAGSFGSWLEETRAALRGTRGTAVPCGDCVGCCVSSYFIPIRPDDAAARAAIPVKWLVAAPGQPPGHEMMGYRDDGTCPMLDAGRCTIYAQRPQTCRDYDCRIFAAAGIEAGGSDKSVINRRVREWRFEYGSRSEEEAHRAMQAAATFIQAKRASFPNGRAPTSPTGIAVLAFKSYTVFVDRADQTRSDAQVAKEIVEASRAFDLREG